MRVLNVKNAIKVGENTLVAVEDKCADIKNGSGVLDSNGKPYVVLSVGTAGIIMTNLLIEGYFESERIFV